jgi:hypothetical protein
MEVTVVYLWEGVGIQMVPITWRSGCVLYEGYNYTLSYVLGTFSSGFHQIMCCHCKLGIWNIT